MARAKGIATKKQSPILKAPSSKQARRRVHYLESRLVRYQRDGS